MTCVAIYVNEIFFSTFEAFLSSNKFKVEIDYKEMHRRDFSQ
jgi:hypothetical protein